MSLRDSYTLPLGNRVDAVYFSRSYVSVCFFFFYDGSLSLFFFFSLGSGTLEGSRPNRVSPHFARLSTSNLAAAGPASGHSHSESRAEGSLLSPGKRSAAGRSTSFTSPFFFSWIHLNRFPFFFLLDERSCPFREVA